jgi:ABC-type Fe3+-hydroxamate transport system substrate-binding protein
VRSAAHSSPHARSGFLLLFFPIFFLFILTCFFSVACDRTPQAPASPPSNPHPRIACLSPAAAVTLRDLGIESQIVGRHAYDLALDPKLPVAGDQAGVDYERLLLLKPTHVVMQWGQRDLPPRLTELAAAKGWTIVPYNPLALDEIIDATRTLAAAFPATKIKADELVSHMRTRWLPTLADVRVRRQSIGRVLLLIGMNPPGALGPGSFHQDMLERLGGIPAIKEGKPYIRLDKEDVLRLAPDAIVLIMPRTPRTEPGPPPSWDKITEALSPLAGLDIPAIQRKRVAIIDDPLAHTPSSAMLGLTDEMKRILEAWANN